ncbi:hypothetical protein NQZ68_016356 [Dissostichus eleginoides]|nr:hypothetical protein NQZ68_016356 [Dissostichus eleginoides]
MCRGLGLCHTSSSTDQTRSQRSSTGNSDSINTSCPCLQSAPNPFPNGPTSKLLHLIDLPGHAPENPRSQSVLWDSGMQVSVSESRLQRIQRGLSPKEGAISVSEGGGGHDGARINLKGGLVAEAG